MVLIEPELEKIISPFLPIWDALPTGIAVTDRQGNILFYNKAQSLIDKLPIEFALGKNVHYLYGPDPGPSLVVACLQSKKPIINYVCVYRTVNGDAINSATWVFPIFKDNVLLGSICYVNELDKLSEPPVVSSIKDLPAFNTEKVAYTNLTSKSSKMNEAIETANHAAGTPSPVLLYGKTGTGKDIFARNIHCTSINRNNPFVTVNCSAIPETLLEGLLFGTTKGSFTGAMDKSGLFEQANGGTLFLDEMDSMPLSLQPKLLRVLQDKKIRRMGSDKEIQLSIKIISAMSRDPLESVSLNKVRADLFYRLGVVVIGIPPLKDRLEDLEDLCTFFILKDNTLFGKKVRTISQDLMDLFYAYQWPGNVRELEHLIEASMNITHNAEVIESRMVPEYFLKNLRPRKYDIPVPSEEPRPGAQITSFDESAPLPTLEQLSAPINQDEKSIIIRALSKTFGNITMAAGILGVSRQNLSYKMKKYELNRNDFRTLHKD
jgi:arginine utilization regulatory protein